MFKSIDELDKFSFDDAVCVEINKAQDGIVIDCEALIVKPNNSQNTNFTESYAGPSVIKFENGSIENIEKAGFKYYDANGKLIKDVPDEPVNKVSWGGLIKSFSGMYLSNVTKEGETYLAEIEFTDDDGAVADTYLVTVKATGFLVTWEKYLNRVQR